MNTTTTMRKLLLMTYDKLFGWLYKTEPVEVSFKEKDRAMCEMFKLIREITQTASTQTAFAGVDNMIDAFTKSYRDMPDGLSAIDELTRDRNDRWTVIKLEMRKEEDFQC